MTQSLLAFRYFGWRATPLAILTAGLAIGAVYGGFHYLIDVIAGALLGGIVFLIGRLATAQGPRV
jgi:membrane-associated phospholipid phosphatase